MDGKGNTQKTTKKTTQKKKEKEDKNPVTGGKGNGRGSGSGRNKARKDNWLIEQENWLIEQEILVKKIGNKEYPAKILNTLENPTDIWHAVGTGKDDVLDKSGSNSFIKFWIRGFMKDANAIESIEGETGELEKLFEPSNEFIKD